MHSSNLSRGGFWVALIIVAAFVASGSVSLLEQARAAVPGVSHVVFSGALPNVPGKALTAVVVEYPAGGGSLPHRHAGSVFAFVLSGQIRSEVSTSGPARIYHPGEGFFEPPGSTHLVSENASATEPASLLAVFVADEHAQLTTPAH